jgi:spore coat protein U-like protein
MKWFLLALIALSTNAVAQQAIPVSTTVSESCVISSTPLNFGPYDPTANNNRLRAQSLITVKCTNGGASKRVALGEGKNPTSGSTCASPLRRMISPQGDFLSYQIYVNASENIPWGHCVNNSMVLVPPSTSSLVAQEVPVFGAVLANQDAQKGNYTDTLNIRISF